MMILHHFSFVTACLITVILHANLSKAALDPPACFQNCTLAVLDSAGCELKSIRKCLCASHVLQYELSLCILSSCSPIDQIISTNILQNETCLGVPYPSRKAEIIRAEIILTAFTFLSILSRLISRAWVARKVWWDDWMVIFAAVLMVPNTAIPIYTAYHGFGTHIWNVPEQDQVLLPKLYYSAQIFYTLMQCLAKFSILFIYLRIFPLPQFRLIVKVCIGWMACHTLIFTLGTAIQCLPVKFLWDPTINHKCINIHAFAISGAVFSIFEDLVIMLLPVRQFRGLPFKIRKRITLCLMFALGSFACITSMIRLKYLKDYYPSFDSSWNNVDIVIWSDIETYTAIICSCLMCLRPLLKKSFPSLFPTARNEFTTENLNEYPNSNSQPFDRSLASTVPPHSREGKFDDRLKSSHLSFQSRGFGVGQEVWDEGYSSTMVFHETGDQKAKSADYELEESGVTPCIG